METDFEIVQPFGRRMLLAAKKTVLWLMLPAIWFLGVDRTMTVETCSVCIHGSDLFEYRVFGIPVSSQRREIPTILEYVFRDLGAPCDHGVIDRHVRSRYWGLVICTCPCSSGVYRLSGDIENYEWKYQPFVIAFGEEHPNASDELRRLRQEEDWQSVRQFYCRMYGERDYDEIGRWRRQDAID